MSLLQDENVIPRCHLVALVSSLRDSLLDVAGPVFVLSDRNRVEGVLNHLFSGSGEVLMNETSCRVLEVRGWEAGFCE